MKMVSFIEINSSQLSATPIVDGQLVCCLDTSDFYRDISNSRIKLSSDIIFVDSLPLAPLYNRIYFLSTDCVLYTYLNNDWIAINMNTNTLISELNKKVDKVSGKGLSTNDFTNELKTKLDGIATGANKYTLPTASSSKLGGVKIGSNITNSSGTISITKANVTAALGYTPPTTDTHYESKNVVGSNTATSNTTIALTNGNVYLNSVENGAVTSSHKISGSGATSVTTDASGNIIVKSTNTTYPTATTSANGLMSSSDKSKLDGIATGANKTIVDSTLSSTSTNPVQNKVINTALSGKLNISLKGSNNGLAELDENGKVPSSQLPSYVDDVIEGYLNSGKFYIDSEHKTEITGETGKIYINLSNSKTYRWSGSAFVVISETIALGETSSTAYRGDKGKAAYNHSQLTSGNPHKVTKSDVGLSNVENKSSATIRGELTKDNVVAALGYTPPAQDTNTHYASKNVVGGNTATSNTTSALTNGNVYLNSVENGAVTSSHKISGSGATTVITDTSGNIIVKSTNTTYSTATTSANGLMSSSDKTKLDGIATGANKYTLPTATDSVLGGVKTGSNITNSSGTISITKDNVTSALGYTPPTQDTTYSNATTSTAGLMSSSDKTKLDGIAAGANKYTLPTASNSTLGGVKTGSNITNSSGTISITKANVCNALGYTPPEPDLVTSDNNGLMSSSDKTKLDGIATGANKYVLPTASSTLGGVKTTSTVTEKTGYTATPIINGVPYYKGLNSLILLTDEDLNDYKTAIGQYYAGGTNTCVNVPDGVKAFNLSIYRSGSITYVQRLSANMYVLNKNREYIRIYYSETDSWSEWFEFYSSNNKQPDADPTQHTLTSKDLNDVKDYGEYYAGGGNTCANKPDNVSCFHLKVGRGSDTNEYVVQELVQTNVTNPKKFIRLYKDNAWGEWDQYYTSKNKMTKSDIGLGNVENKSSATIRGELTKANVTAALGYTPPTQDTNTHYESKNVVGSSTATSNTTSALTNGNVYLNSVENGAVTSSHKISGSGATTVITDTNGNIIIKSTDNNTTYSVATTSANGLMSSSDKTKLDGIATGANKYTLPTASSSKLGGVKIGSNITNSSGTISITKANVTAALGYTPPTTDTNTHYESKNVVGSNTATSNTTSALTNGNVYLNSVENGAVTSSHKISGSGATSVTTDANGNIVISSTNTTYSTATTSANGLMSSSDKSKLDGIATGANKTVVDSALSDTSTNPVQNKVVYSALSGKSDTNHTHNYAGSSSAGGSADSAVKLQTARTINGVSFDGTKNISITANPTQTQLTNQDLNTVKTYGEYYAGGGNTCANVPGGAKAFNLKVYRSASGYIVQELIVGTSSGAYKKYSRQYSTSWTEWKYYIDSSNIYDIAFMPYVGYSDDDILGLEVDYENNKCTRLAGASGLSAGTDFDKFNMYGGRKRCLIHASGVLGYYGDEAYTSNINSIQSIGLNVMVYQPRFYYKIVPIKLERNTDGIGYYMKKGRYYISDSPKSGFKLHPAFYDEDGNELEGIYYSAYENSIRQVSNDGNKITYTSYLNNEITSYGTKYELESIPGAIPCNAISITDLEKFADPVNGYVGISSFHLETIKTLSANQLLMMIEYGSLNLQNTLNKGISTLTSATSPIVTGGTESLGNASGMASGTEGEVSFSYRGMENIYGNIFKSVQGILLFGNGNKKGGQPYIAKGFNYDYSTDPLINYDPVNFYIPSSGGYIKYFGYDENFDWLFLPVNASGSSTAPVGDYIFDKEINDTFPYKISYGGRYKNKTQVGPFTYSANIAYNSVNTSSETGGRVVYYPKYKGSIFA